MAGMMPKPKPLPKKPLPKPKGKSMDLSNDPEFKRMFQESQARMQKAAAQPAAPPPPPPPVRGGKSPTIRNHGRGSVEGALKAFGAGDKKGKKGK
jgi:hypothetical protein